MGAFSGNNAPNGAASPATDMLEITPSNDDDLATPARAFYAEVAGDVKVVTDRGNTRTVPVGAFQVIPCGITKVFATGTTATGIVVLTN